MSLYGSTMKNKLLQFPFDATALSLNKTKLKKSLREAVEASSSSRQLKVAVLGGGTTNKITDALELKLLSENFNCSFYNSEYNRFFEEVVFDTGRLWDFSPDVIYICTSIRNIDSFPTPHDNAESIAKKVDTTFAKYLTVWNTIQKKSKAIIIQNNFEPPHQRILGNLSSQKASGECNFINMLNSKFSDHITSINNIYLCDLHYLSSQYGLMNWYDQSQWFNYKFAFNTNASLLVAASVTAIINAVHGRTKKCLVLDLDNTLWGGVIGDDGIAGILLGNDNPIGEAYSRFQTYLKSLKDRGVILAICSKNNHDIALEGLNHPDSVLKPEDFASIQANWNEKSKSLVTIAEQLNLGIESFVFIDDSSFERNLMQTAFPNLDVPDIGGNPENFPDYIDKNFYFETVQISEEDLKKNQLYQDNHKRESLKAEFSDYTDYLKSLNMVAEISPFRAEYLDRIVQLLNKTNQFNFTGLRYQGDDIQKILSNKAIFTLSVKLKDSIGDNGIVSILIADIQNNTLNIQQWVMSCRVFNRHLEYAIFDELVRFAQSQKLKTIVGKYIPTERNQVILNLYRDLGFTSAFDTDWILNVDSNIKQKNTVIKLEHK